VLVVSEKGYGKRSPVEDYRITNRGGKGVKTLQVTDKTGPLIAIKDVKDDDHLMIINRSGITIRMDLSEMRVLGRATQGVRLIELRKNDSIAAVAKVDSSPNEIHPDHRGPVRTLRTARAEQRRGECLQLHGRRRLRQGGGIHRAGHHQ
jgi:DNA gyrase subunit A